jgi:DNA-binding response OmpR family regulator
MTRRLDGMSILIVEDEVIIGMMLASEISRAGGNPVGPVTSVASALKEIEQRPLDLVMLDAKLGDGSGAELAACLEARSIPYVVVSGYDKAHLPQALRNAVFVAKPVSLPGLMEAIDGLGIRSGRRRTPPQADAIAVPDGPE